MAEAAAPFIGPWAGLIPPAFGIGGSMLVGGAVGIGQEKLLEKYAPGLMKRIAAGSEAHPVAAGIGGIASGAAGFEFAPGQTIKGIADMARRDFASKAARATQAQLGTQLGITALQTGVLEHRLPTPGELLEAAGTAALYGHPRETLTAKGPKTKIEEYYARRKQEAAEVHGPVRTQPEQGPGQVPAQVGGPRVQPQAQELAKATQIPLKEEEVPQFTGSEETGWTLHFQGKSESGFNTRKDAEDAAMQIMEGVREMGGARPADLVEEMERAAIDEGKNTGVPVTPVDKFTGEDDATVPFSGFLMATGEGAELHRRQFRMWIEQMAARGLSRGEIHDVVVSRINEEKVHNDVMRSLDKGEVSDYWKNLSDWEKKIESYIYHGATEQRYSDIQMGHEAIRRRMQQAMGMTPGEFLEVLGTERVKLKSLDVIGRMIRRGREALGTKASARQRYLYDKALYNINYAKAALTGRQMPFATRRKTDYRRELPEMDSDLMEAIIIGDSRKNDEQARQMGYEPNLFTSLTSLAWKRPQEWNLSPKNRERLVRWWSAAEGTGYGRSEILADGIHATEVYAKQQLDKAAQVKRVLQDFGDKMPPVMREAQHNMVNRLEQDAQNLLDGLPQSRKLLEELTGQKGAKFEDLPKDLPFELDYWRNEVERLERNMPEYGDPRRKYWQQSLAKAKDELQRFETEHRSMTEDLGLRPPTPPDHPEFPFASRREKQRAREQEQGQKEAFGPEVKGLGSTIKPTPPEQRKIAELAGPVGAIEQAAQSIFEGRLPAIAGREPEQAESSFREFLKWAKRNVSSSVQPGPLFDVWLNTVNRNLERASGKTLNDMVERLGVQHRVYPFKRVPSKLDPEVEKKMREEGSLKAPPQLPLPTDPALLEKMRAEGFTGAAQKIGKQYSRVEIPDYRDIPPDPDKLPMAVEQSIRARVAQTPMFAEGTMAPEKLAAEQDKAVAKARKEVMDYVKAHTTPEERATRKLEREGAIKGQKLRMKALSAIFGRMIEEGAPTLTDLSPADITHEDIAWNNPNAKKYGAYHTITPAERANSEKLRDILSEEARRSKFDPVSVTRRLVVMRNKNSGQVALVSAYPTPRSEGGIRLVEPSGATGVRGRPNVSIQSAMSRGWEPIISVLRKEPLQNFSKSFKDIADFNRYLGSDAAQMEANSAEELVGMRPDDVHEDIPEFATRQDWLANEMAKEPVVQDLETAEGETTFRPGSAVGEGEGGGFIGPEAGEARGAPGDRWNSTPLSVREAMAIHNWLNDPDEWAGSTGLRPRAELERVSTRPEMREAITRLTDLAESGKLKPRQWEVIMGLHKIALAEYLKARNDFAAMLREERQSPDVKKMTRAERIAHFDKLRTLEPTAEGSMAAALDKIYDINQSTDKQADYLANVLGEFTRPDIEAKGPETVQRPAPARPGETGPVLQEPGRVLQGKEFIGPQQPTVTGGAVAGIPSRPVEGVQREVTMIPRRPPTSTTWQGPVRPPEPVSPAAPGGPEKLAALAGTGESESYQPTVYLRNIPTTESHIGGPGFTGEPPRVYEKPAPLMPHELMQDEPLVYPKTVEKTRAEFIGPRKPGEMPLAANRAQKFVKERWDDMREGAIKYVGAPVTRAQTIHDINASGDGADRNVEMYANGGGLEIRIASVKGDKTKPTLKERFFGGKSETPQAKMVRLAAKAVLAARQIANDERWREVAAAWRELRERYKPAIEEAKRRHKKRPEIPEEEKPKYAPAEELKPEHFDKLIEQANRGIREAEDWTKAVNRRTRIAGRRWLKAAKELKEQAEYAKEHYKDAEMVDTVETFQAVTNQHLKNMNDYGLNVSGRDFYVPGLYQGEYWNDYGITWGDMRILGRNYRMPKTFRNYYEAIAAGPYTPVNGDVADLAQHTLAAGGRILFRDQWLNNLKNFIDPQSKQPVAIEPQLTRYSNPKIDPDKVGALDPEMMVILEGLDAEISRHNPDTREGRDAIKRLASYRKAISQGSAWGWQVPKGKMDYTLVRTTANSKPIAVRKGYEKVIQSVMAQSVIPDIPVLGQALMASQMLKHGLILIFDSFHPGRLAQYAGAVAGKNLWSVKKPGFHAGLHAIMYNPEALQEAVAKGMVSEKQARWATEPIKIYDKGRIIQTTRQRVLRELLLPMGLNATQTADVLYRNSIQKIPLIGEQWSKVLTPFNKWIFDRITPGMIAQSAVENLERINPKNRHLSLKDQAREVIRDMNIFYGNMGRNGIFKNPNTRDLAQIFILAPLWQNGLIAKEFRTISRATGLSYALGRKGLGADVYFGPLTRGIVRGLGAYFVLSQMANLISRGKPTWENEEPDHKLDAWLPLGKEGIWLSPMSVFGEVTHDLIRLAQAKPKNWDAITQFGNNKLGPIGRMGVILGEGRSPGGEQITSTGGVLARAASELAPAPISLGTFAKAAAPGLLGGPPRPGQVAQRALSSIGIKTQLPTRPETEIRRMADNFVKRENLKFEPMAFSPTDQASYAKLRGALRNGDERGAAKILAELRQHRTDDQIAKAMKQAATRPYTGSKANEDLFLYSLGDKELQLYYEANMERAELYQSFLDWFMSQPLQ